MRWRLAIAVYGRPACCGGRGWMRRRPRIPRRHEPPSSRRARGGSGGVRIRQRRHPRQFRDVVRRQAVLDRTGDDKIAVPVERDARRVDMPHAGHIGHGVRRACVRKADLHGAPDVAARVYPFHSVEILAVGLRYLVQHAKRRRCFATGRDERAFPRTVRPDLVEPHDEPRGPRDPARDGRRCAGRIGQPPRQHVRAVREVLHEGVHSLMLNAGMACSTSVRCHRAGASTGRSVVTMAKIPSPSRAGTERVIIQISPPPASK